MAAPTDFLRLYQELGLAPGASMEQVKHAYRRRVAELHPDRAGKLYSASTDDAATRLQFITQQYNAAAQFYRQHGRLPGSVVPARAVPPADAGAQVSRDEPAATPHSRTSFYVALAAVAIAALVFWWEPWNDEAAPVGEGATSGEPSSSHAERDEAMTTDAIADDMPTELEIGMTADDVAKLEERPITRDDARWDYGPSWIEFEKGKVVDWYSSPLRPLHHASTRPHPAMHVHER